ncbi:MAG TPA: hypothetical protein VGC76_11045 [Pyrinomonadaceae bacterium]|jgi:hypothetical protein
MKKVILTSLFLLTFNFLAYAQSSIRQVDFNNFTYKPYCAAEDTRDITVKNSEFLEEKQTGDDVSRLYFKVFALSYGDFNGDGKDEAFALTYCNLGGEGYTSEGFVYTMKNDKPVLLARIQGGDRAQGGLRSAKVEKGMFVLERYAVDETGYACCPEFIVTTNYKWNGRELVEVGVPAKRDLYPSTPVTFEKDKNSVNLNVSIPSGKFKRYVVSGRVGQTLTISTDAKNVAVKLVRGAADVNETARGFLAVLNDNGEFIVQVQDISGSGAEAVVKIEIK